MQYPIELATNKHFLYTIAKNNYEIPDGFDCFDFAKALLVNFASTDGELRDDLSYMIMANGLIDKRKLTTEQMKQLLLLALDHEHLFYHIGDVGTDTVFMRSFSNLLIAALLYADAKDPAFSEQTIQQVKFALFRYAQEERDWRGHVEGKGWAHAMAHLADALDECAQSQSVTRTDREQIMETIRELAQISKPLYHEEDMRLAAVAQHIIETREVDDDFLSRWLQSCYVERGQDVASWISATNSKNFLRSLYFLLAWDNMAAGLTNSISHVLRRQDQVYLQTSAR